MPNYHAYDYTRGINWIGMLCIGAGVGMSFLIYNPLTREIHSMLLFHLTPTGFSFLGTGVLYYLLSKLPIVRKYLLRDREELTI